MNGKVAGAAGGRVRIAGAEVAGQIAARGDDRGEPENERENMVSRHAPRLGAPRARDLTGSDYPRSVAWSGRMTRSITASSRASSSTHSPSIHSPSVERTPDLTPFRFWARIAF